ncbi:hypothetical protein ABIB94_008914 [Bradyrhizobium sp. JR7.2]
MVPKKDEADLLPVKAFRLARVGLRVRLQPSTPGRRNRGTNLLAPKQSAASSSLAWANPLAPARLRPRPKPHQTELGRWQVTRSTSSKTPRPVRMTRSAASDGSSKGPRNSKTSDATGQIENELTEATIVGGYRPEGKKQMIKPTRSAKQQVADDADRRALNPVGSRQTIADSQAAPEFQENLKRLKAERLEREARLKAKPKD